MALITDNVVVAVITSSLAFMSVVFPLYWRNRRALTKRAIPAEEVITTFIREEIAKRDALLEERDKTIESLERTLKRWTQKSYKQEAIIRELRRLIKELREENRIEKEQNNQMKEQLSTLRESLEKVYAKRFVQAIKDEVKGERDRT